MHLPLKMQARKVPTPVLPSSDARRPQSACEQKGLRGRQERAVLTSILPTPCAPLLHELAVNMAFHAVRAMLSAIC